ncbi:MAG: DUF669 domain-containing protein [Elusimicrobia bacterium]|nr:DUF669 domain-containing protein [Elusimicrobiota bacterium]
MSFYYDATNVQPMGGFTPIPKGKYLLRVESATQKRSRNGDPMVVVDFTVAEGQYQGRRIRFHNVTFLPPESKGAGISIHFLKTIGESYEGRLEIAPERWIGKLLYGHVEEEPDLNGTPRNVVKNVEPCETPGGEPADNGEATEEINF